MVGFLLATLVGCVAQDPPARRPFVPVGASPEAANAAGPRAKGKAAPRGKAAYRAKAAKSAKGAKHAPRAAKAPTPAAPAAVGVPGAVTGILTLTPGTGPDGVTPVTTPELALTFADQTSHVEKLGAVPGACTEQPAAPITTPKGQTIPVLWTVTCGTATVVILQKDASLLIVRSDPNPAAPEGNPKVKVLKRMVLAPGALVARKA